MPHLSLAFFNIAKFIFDQHDRSVSWFIVVSHQEYRMTTFHNSIDTFSPRHLSTFLLYIFFSLVFPLTRFSSVTNDRSARAAIVVCINWNKFFTLNFIYVNTPFIVYINKHIVQNKRRRVALTFRALTFQSIYSLSLHTNSIRIKLFLPFYKVFVLFFSSLFFFIHNRQRSFLFSHNFQDRG